MWIGALVGLPDGRLILVWLLWDAMLMDTIYERPTWGEQVWLWLLMVWAFFTFRKIFAIGMYCVALVAAYRPAGSIAIAADAGFDPFLHALWWMISGFVLAELGDRGFGWRWLATLPLLVYIGFSFEFVRVNWGTANLVVPILYIMLYLAMLKLIVDKD